MIRVFIFIAILFILYMFLPYQTKDALDLWLVDNNWKLFLIILLSGLATSFLIRRMGCSKSTEDTIVSTPCIKKYPFEAPDEWRIICEKAPYFDCDKIPKDVEEALIKIGFLCPGFPLPTAKEINSVCDHMIL